MKIVLSLHGLLHLVRAGLLGGLVLLVVGALLIMGERQHAQPRPATEPAAAATDHGDAPAAAAGPSDVPRVRLAQIAFFGAIAGMGTLLLLCLFPVGPASKILFGIFLGPVLPALLLGRKQGNPDELGGLIVLGALVGLLVGVLEANRVRARRERLPEIPI